MLGQSAAALGIKDAISWWDTVNKSAAWQDRIFHVLAVLYGLVAAVALVQLVRIHLRVPEYGWTTQKVFHFFNFLVNGVRCIVFILRRDVQKLDLEIVQHILLDLPSLAFFTTYALLVLFWAEIYYQARAVSTDWLRPTFYAINGIVFAIQVFLFRSLGVSSIWWKAISDVATIPCRIKGRRKKLQEVGYVTTICFSCFLIRSIMMCFNALEAAANLDVLDHSILNFIYYFLVEILPCALVLLILRKLPPRRGVTQYHPIR